MYSPQKLKNLFATHQELIPGQTHWCCREGHCLLSFELKMKCLKCLMLFQYPFWKSVTFCFSVVTDSGELFLP